MTLKWLGELDENGRSWIYHHFKKEEPELVGELSKVCSQIVLEKACICHELVDLTFFGLSTNLQEQSQNGQEPVTDD